MVYFLNLIWNINELGGYWYKIYEFMMFYISKRDLCEIYVNFLYEKEV